LWTRTFIARFALRRDLRDHDVLGRPERGVERDPGHAPEVRQAQQDRIDGVDAAELEGERGPGHQMSWSR